MSDDTPVTPAPPVAPAPFDMQPQPQPVPLPVTAWQPQRSAPPAGRRRTVLVAVAVAVVALLVLLGCCLSGPVILQSFGPALGEGIIKTVGPRIWPGEPAVYWTDDGRYLVIQSVDLKVNGARTEIGPLVTAVNMGTGATVDVRGYRVVSMERAAPRVWLVPDTARPLPVSTSPGQSAPDVSVHQAYDGWDGPSPSLVVWDVTRPPSTIARPAESAWRPWRGPSGIVARLAVDPAAGGSPAELSFETTYQPPVVAIAPGVHALPGEPRTFEPIGWSPSGRYFAVVSLVRRESDTQDFGPTLEDTKEFGLIQALVYSTSDGSLVASCGVGAMIAKDLRRQVAWGTVGDELYCISAADSVARGGTPLETDFIRSLSVIQPSANLAVRDFFDGGRGMAYAFDGYPASLLGGGSDLVLTSPGAYDSTSAHSVWRLAHPEPTLVGTWNLGAPLAWATAPDGTIAVLRQPKDTGSAVFEVATGKPRESLKTVWSLGLAGQPGLAALLRDRAGTSGTP